jgi:predicted dehydrogenase
LHEEHVRLSLENGLHVLCEKPFLLDDKNYSDTEAAKKLFELARHKKVLTVNMQWPSIIPYIMPYVDFSKISRFYSIVETGKTGAEMLTEHLPHSNSMLLQFASPSEVKHASFPVRSANANRVRFDYSGCSVIYDFIYKKNRPRKLTFTFDGREFSREVYGDYEQRLNYRDNVIEIDDPLRISIRRFVDAVEKNTETLVSEERVLENMRLQNAILSAYEKS